MKVRVPFVYDAMVIPRKARNAREESFGEWAEFDLLEVSGEDAPVALRWRERLYGWEHGGVGGVCERRWFAGALWRPVIRTYSGEPNVHVTTAEALAAAEEGRGHLVTGYDWKIDRFVRQDQGEVAPLDPDAYRQVESSGREEAFAAAAARFEDRLSVDGMLWKRTYEPVYRVSDSGGFQRYIRIEITEPPADDGKFEGVFRIDRFDDFRSYAASRFGETVEDDWRVEVFVPEAVNFEDEMNALLSGLHDNLVWQNGSLHEKPTPWIMAWAALRDALSQARETHDEDDCDMAAEAAVRWLEDHHVDDWTTSRLRAVVNRWNARPIVSAIARRSGR